MDNLKKIEKIFLYMTGKYGIIGINRLFGKVKLGRRKETFMLVLSRKLDESLIIDGQIEIVVTGISGNKVTLGITAPGNVSVYRKELCLLSDEQAPKRRNGNRAKHSCWCASGKIQPLKCTIR